MPQGKKKSPNLNVFPQKRRRQSFKIKTKLIHIEENFQTEPCPSFLISSGILGVKSVFANMWNLLRKAEFLCIFWVTDSGLNFPKIQKQIKRQMLLLLLPKGLPKWTRVIPVPGFLMFQILLNREQLHPSFQDQQLCGNKNNQPSIVAYVSS